MSSATYYVLHPGPVTSRTDGQQHWVSGSELARLYGVRERDCVIARGEPGARYPEGCVHLHPRFDGDYALPVKETPQ